MPEVDLLRFDDDALYSICLLNAEALQKLDPITQRDAVDWFVAENNRVMAEIDRRSQIRRVDGLAESAISDAMA